MIVELMERFMEFATTWLWLVSLATWRAMPILVIVIGIGIVLRRKLSPSLHALLLTIVLVRLLLPVSVGSPLSLHKSIDKWVSGGRVESAERSISNLAHDHAYGILPNVDRSSMQDSATQVPTYNAIANDFSWEAISFAVILIFVVSVSIVLLLRGVLSHIRFAIRLRSCRLLDQQPLIDLLLRECDSLVVGRRPALREVPSLAAPAVFGLFRQTICIPPSLIDTLTEQELHWVIRHELAHIRRRDIPVMILASAVVALHWFNPIVWLVVSRLRAAMEAAADRLAVQRRLPSEASAYGKLLLRLAEESLMASNTPTLGLISFASGSRLKQRVAMLMQDGRPSNLPAKLWSLGLVAAIAFAGLTDAKDSVDKRMPQVHLLESDSKISHTNPWGADIFNVREDDGPSFIESYDVTSIFETMLLPVQHRGKTELEQFTTWLPLSPSLIGKLRVEEHTLTAELRARQHQLLKQMIETWENGEPRQISIETRFIQTNIKTASTIDWVGRKIDSMSVKGIGPAIAAHIGEAEFAQLIQTASADLRSNILFAPKVTMFGGQTANIADQVQHSFVTGIDPQPERSPKPVVSIIDEGLSLLLTPKAGEDDSISLTFEIRASRIGKVSYANLPIKTSDGSEPQFTVQVPATEQYELSSSVKLEAGESIVVAIPRVFSNEPGADAETTMIVALTPTIVATPEKSLTPGPNR